MNSSRRPEVCVGAIARRDDSLLLIQRGRGAAVGEWSVPGGRVEFGESLAEAARRETAEDTYRSVVSHLSAEDKAALDRQTQKTDPEFNDSIAVHLPENYLKNYERETLENESFLQTMFGLIDEFAQIILRMKWQLRVTDPDRIFTGDAPVYWSDLNEPGANLLFPISSRAIFYATLNWTISETVFFEHRKEFISIIRDGFARQCKELYCSNHQRWLVDFFNKR